jgi:WD40 repeat protein
MFTKRQSHLLIIALFVIVLLLTACAPRVGTNPNTTSMPAGTSTSEPTSTQPKNSIAGATSTQSKDPAVASATQETGSPVSISSADTPTIVEGSPLGFKGHTADIWDVAISPDGKYLATASSDKTARLWDLATGETVQTFTGHTDELGSVVFSPDGKYLLTGSLDHVPRLWDLATGQTVQTFSGHTDGGDWADFSPDGKFMVSAGFTDGTARIWDVATGETLHILPSETGWAIKVAYSPDGRYVLIGGGTAQLWDAASGEPVRVFSGQDNLISTVAFSPDGKYVATGSDDYIAAVWEVATGEMVNEFKGHTGYVNGVAISPDGKYLLTGSSDQTVRLWDIATGQCLYIFEDHRGSVQGVTFSPDGNLIATSSNDTVARVWNLQSAIAASPSEGKTESTTLHLAVADEGGHPSEAYVLEFVKQVETLSNGDLTIEPIWDAGRDTEAGFEIGVIQLVREGDAELGLAGSRAWDMDQVTSFQALQAPFLITNDALAEAVATSDIAVKMLDSLSSAGIIGLTLWPEDLRHPASNIPGESILSPENISGRLFRVTPSDVSMKLIEALGGELMFGNGYYDGAESGLLQAASLHGSPTITGNVTFFSKYQVLFANEAAFAKLTEEQRAVLRQAAQAAQAEAIGEHPHEPESAVAWCAAKGGIALASDQQIAEFESAAQPVLDWLEQDPLNAEMITAIRDLKANTPPSPGAEVCAP